MDKEILRKAISIKEEIDGLNRFKNFLTHKECGSVAHFEFVQHYGNLHGNERIQINERHSQRFLELLKTIIKELEEEFENL